MCAIVFLWDFVAGQSPVNVMRSQLSAVAVVVVMTESCIANRHGKGKQVRKANQRSVVYMCIHMKMTIIIGTRRGLESH